MNKVYLSFLGLGSLNKEKGKHEYSRAVYGLNGVKSTETQFVQVAEIEMLGSDRFDKVVIVTTRKSYEANFHNLESQLKQLGVTDVHPLTIEEDMSAEGQWEWFEKILDLIETGDELTVDLTHGYRSIPIIFSTAINFLQKARNIELKAVYYGAYEKLRDLGYAPVVDMKEFYVINEWADAVSRLVEDADARKMAQVSDKVAGFQAGELSDEKLIQAFEDLTNTIRDVDVNNVAKKAGAALDLIAEKELFASLTGKILLRLVIDKFSSLAAENPRTGRYDEPYFMLQLEIIRLLLGHRLFMQAYTVMREFIGSIGMIEIEKAKVNTNYGRKLRHRFADVFVNMMQFDESKWKFEVQTEKDKNSLMPYYQKLKQIGVEPILRAFSKDLADYRNGFDHAWTMKSGALPDIEIQGVTIFEKLKEVVQILKENGIF